MVICPQCNIEHDEGEEFCRKCGKFLLTFEEPLPEGEKTEIKLLCPKCQVLYKKGNYCRICGSLLMQGTTSQEMIVQSLDKKSIKRCSKEWLSLLREEKELESCMSNLEAQRGKVSSDVLHPTLLRYKDRLESLSPLHQEIETEFESIRKRASEKIDFLEKELKPIEKNLEEFQSLYKVGAITKADFLREKKELKKEIKSRQRSLKEYRQILSLLPSKKEGRIISPTPTRNLLRPFNVLTAGVIILLIAAGVYFLWPDRSLSSKAILKETVSPPPATPSPNSQPVALEDQENEKIKSLFENIKQANLKKNIELFMSCFSRHFNGLERKRLDTLKTWDNFNYIDLSYDLKKKTISGDAANVRLEWFIRTSLKAGGQLQDGRTVLDVTLKKEDGHWKIKEIKPVS